MRKVFLFPFRILLVLAGGLLDLFIKAECWICGIVFMILAVCILLAVANQMWLQAGILVGCVLAVILGLFLTANIKIWIDTLAEKWHKIVSVHQMSTRCLPNVHHVSIFK